MSVAYRFMVSIQEKGKSRQVCVEKSTFVIGRGKDADIVLTDDLISREQMRISHSLGNIWMEELGSSNGTWLDGKKLQANHKTIYRPGQSLCFGGKSGPVVGIECTVIEDEIIQHTSIPQQFEDEIWIPEKKVANGPSPRQAPKAMPKAPPAVPAREKLSMMPKYEDAGTEDKILKIKNQAEQNLFDHIRSLVGSEAEAIRDACLEEAARVKKNAEIYSSNHIQAARTQAEKTLKDSENYVAKKIAELKHYESQAQKKLGEAQAQRVVALREVEGLKETENTYKVSLETLQENIRFEEQRIDRELKRLENFRTELALEKKHIDDKLADLASEQDRIKGEIEAEISQLETRKAQIEAETTKTQVLKEYLEPTVASLKEEKDSLSEQVSGLQEQYVQQEKKLRSLQHEYAMAKEGLAVAKKDFDVTNRTLEQQRQEVYSLKQHVEELHINAVMALEEAKDQSKKIILEANVKYEVALKEAQEEVAKLHSEKQNLKHEISKERNQRLEAFKEEQLKLVRDHEAAIQRLIEKKAEVVKEVEKIAVAGHEEFHKVINQSKSEAIAIKESAEVSARKTMVEAELVLRAAESESQNKLEVAKKEAVAERERFQQEITQLEARKHAMEEEITAARQKREDILDTAREKAREVMNQAEQDGLAHKKQILDQAKLEAKEVLAKNELEAQEQKAKLQTQMAEIKHAETMKVKEIRTHAEEDWVHKRLDRAKGVATNLFALLASEMYKSRNKVLDDDFIEGFSREFKELVVDTMMDRVGPDTNKLQSILKTSADAKDKEKKFWRKVKISSFSGVALVATLILFPQILTYPRDKIMASFQLKESNNSDAFLSKVKEARIKAIYNPETTPEFKTSYVENVLYTTAFLTRVEDQAFQDKWILELNDYFIKTLDVKDTTIIKFVSLESSLLKELTEMKAGIDPMNIADGIELMNKREAEFKQKLSEIFADPDKVSRYYDFSAKFWNEFYNPRKPAQQEGLTP